MPSAKVTSKGQVTIPKAVRESLGLKAGDNLDFVQDGDGFRIVANSRSIMEFFGMLAGSRSAHSVEEMNAAIAQHVADDHARIFGK